MLRHDFQLSCSCVDVACLRGNIISIKIFFANKFMKIMYLAFLRLSESTHSAHNL